MNDYIVKYEMHEDNQTDVGDEYQYTPEGLYFVVECYVNKGELKDAGSDMRKGDIDDYLISGTGPTAYTYRGVKEEMEEEKRRNMKRLMVLWTEQKYTWNIMIKRNRYGIFQTI